MRRNGAKRLVPVNDAPVGIPISKAVPPIDQPASGSSAAVPTSDGNTKHAVSPTL